jgi:threonine aldolase
MTEEQHSKLRAAGFVYYTFIGSAARFVCSWATTPADVEELVGTLRA